MKESPADLGKTGTSSLAGKRARSGQPATPAAKSDIKPGDIYLVSINRNHTVGHEQWKRRPFVIVSRLSVNRKRWVVVGVPFTRTAADVAKQPPYRITIPASEVDRDVCYTGSIDPSIALVDQIRALSPDRLEVRVGSLSGTALAAVGLGISYLFDLR